MSTEMQQGQPSHVPLSFLDLVPVVAGSTVHDAIENSVRTVQVAEQAGFHRYWVAEHHNTLNIASSATTVLMGRFAQATSKIRIGSDGIMLPNHAPLRVAEDIGTLATMYPDRIDLGLGRAPGTDPRTAAELRRGASDVSDFADDISQLQRYLADPEKLDKLEGLDDGTSTTMAETHNLFAGAGSLSGSPGMRGRIVAFPGQGTEVPMYVLGSSGGGATVAAMLGLPFAFASHFAPFQLEHAINLYRKHFDASAPTAQISEPKVMVAVNAMAAETTEQAEFEFSVVQQMFLRLGRGGSRKPLPEPTTTPQAGASPAEWQRVQASLGVRAVGTPDEVVADLENVVAATGADELILTTYAHDPEVRNRSIELIGQAWKTS